MRIFTSTFEEDIADAKAAQRLNWWPEVGPDVELQRDEILTIGDIARTVPVWSDGIFRIKLFWPESLIAKE